MRLGTSRGASRVRGPRRTAFWALASVAIGALATLAGGAIDQGDAAEPVTDDDARCRSAHAVVRQHDFTEIANMSMLMNEAIRKGKTEADIPGYGDALGRLASAPATSPCAQRYRAAALALADSSVAARACQEIVGSDPSIGGVNAFLTCITPVNAAAIAAGAEVRAASTAVAAGNGGSCALPAANFSTGPPTPFTDYARAVTRAAALVSAVRSGAAIRSGGRKVRRGTSSVRSHKPGIRCLARKGCDSFETRFNGGTKVVYTDGSVEYYDGAGRAVLPPPGRGDVAAEVVDTTVPREKLTARQLRLVKSLEGQYRFKAAKVNRSLETASHAARPRLAGRVIVVTARRSGLSVAPPWLRALGAGLGPARAAEAAAVQSLAGDPATVLPEAPSAPAPIRTSMKVSRRGAAALNRVIQNQHARAVAALAAARAAGALRWMPDGALNPWTKSIRDARRAELAAQAAELSRLSAAYPALVRSAQAAMRPTGRARVAVVVSGPRILQIPDLGVVLSASSSTRGARVYAALAAAAAG